MKDSSFLVILVLLVCLLGGGSALYLLKARRDAVKDYVILGSSDTGFIELHQDEDWKEHVRLTTEGYTLIIEGVPLTQVPGQCKLRAQIVGSQGEFLFQEEFKGGHRIDARSGRKSSQPHAGPGLVELRCERYINGRHVRNDFSNSLHTIGPKLPERDPDAWEASLFSPDPAEVLWALVGMDAQKEAGPSARTKIADLTSSSNPWIAEAAKVALAASDQ